MICVDCKKRESKTPNFRYCNACYVKVWKKRNPEGFRQIRRRQEDRVFFGGKREQVLERDQYACVICSMTQEAHIKKYGQSLAVHHIDGKGSGVLPKERNNNLDNLATLCMSCHRRIEIMDSELNGKKLFKLTNKKLGIWSNKHDKCVQCNKTNSRHVGAGICNRCYTKNRYDKLRVAGVPYWKKWTQNLPKIKNTKDERLINMIEYPT